MIKIVKELFKISKERNYILMYSLVIVFILWGLISFYNIFDFLITGQPFYPTTYLWSLLSLIDIIESIFLNKKK